MNTFKKTMKGANWSSRQTTAVASYNDLVELFGEPTHDEPSGDGKVDIEWILEDKDGNVVTLYNWKDYDDGYTARNTKDYEWHIGGYNRAVADELKEFIEDV